MDGTARPDALVEELRAVAPRPRTGGRPARRSEASVRTIERDLGALQQPELVTIHPQDGVAVPGHRDRMTAATSSEISGPPARIAHVDDPAGDRVELLR